MTTVNRSARPAADAECERLRGVSPGQEAIDHEGHSQGEEEAEQDPRLAVEAVHRPQDGEVEQQPQETSGDQAYRYGRDRAQPSLHREDDGHRRQDGHLPVRQVEHPTEPVDQCEPAGQQTELEPKDDPVEEGRRHAIPR